MRDAVQALLRRHGQLFVAGQLEAIVPDYVLPCPVEVNGEMTVFLTCGALRDGLAAYRAHFVGLVELDPRVRGVEVLRGDRFRAWVRWAHRFADRTVPNGSQVVYYLHSRPDGRLLVEMVDYVDISAAAARAIRPGLAGD